MKLCYSVILFGVALLGFGLAGCYEEGPATRTGREIDRSTERAADKIEDAGDDIKDAAK